MQPRVIRLRQVLDRTGLSRSTLYWLRTSGAFPDRVRLSSRTVGWIEPQVDAWLATRIVASHTPAGLTDAPARFSTPPADSQMPLAGI